MDNGNKSTDDQDVVVSQEDLKITITYILKKRRKDKLNRLKERISRENLNFKKQMNNL